MERRLKLLEKLQPTKLNKLTVKQGGVDVKLNLKKDLADPNVSIDDKVLEMLEKYVTQPKGQTSKQEEEPTKQTSSSIDKDKEVVEPLSTTTAKEAETTDETTTAQVNNPSPTKRVRFDAVKSQVLSEKEKQTKEIKQCSPVKKTSSILVETRNDNDKTVAEELENDLETNASAMTTTTSEEPKQREHSCRLCKLKCTNERSLYEHVTRLHGGKGSFNQQFISKLKGASAAAANDNDEEDEEMEMMLESSQHHNSSLRRNNSMNSDLDEDVEMTMDEGQEDDEASFQSSSSIDLSLRKSQTHQHKLGNHPHQHHNRPAHKQPLVPRPNVAIRVAKVAYYNSKGNTSSSANPFKSNIFSNGGLRGNFFSQERLPLRSCKIKMKITSSSGFGRPDNTDDDEDETSSNDDFLVNMNHLVRLETLDRNRTLSIQSSHSVDAVHEQLITNKEIRLFFKSLLNYIPQNNPNRLDDMLIEHKSYLSELGIGADVNRCLRIIHSNILDAKQFGVTLFELRRKTNEKLSSEKQSMLKINDLKRLIGFLIDYYLVLMVGVVEHVFVCHEFKQHWVIQSYKSLKGRGAFEESFANEEIIEEEEINPNDNLETTAAETTSIEKETTETTTEGEREKPKRPKRASKSSLSQQAEEVEEKIGRQQQPTAKNFKQVCLIPRPWRYIDGLLNRPVLKQMLESILIYLKTYPNSSSDSICEHYCPALQPVMTVELLEMLERIKCVSKRTLKRQSQCDLFSDFTNGSDEIVDEAELLGNELFVYYLRQNSMFTFKKVFPN